MSFNIGIRLIRSVSMLWRLSLCFLSIYSRSFVLYWRENFISPAFGSCNLMFANLGKSLSDIHVSLKFLPYLVHSNLKHLLSTESVKQGDFNHSTILPKHRLLAAKSLKTNPNIIIRRADKSNTFVILDRIEYKTKLDTILSDTSKLKKFTRNPTNTFTKISVNKIISSVNKRTGKKNTTTNHW